MTLRFDFSCIVFGPRPIIRLGPRSIHGGGRAMDQRPNRPERKSRRREGDHRGRKGRRTKEMVAIARERMDLLMAQALNSSHDGDMVKANRYAGLARRIGMRYNVRMRPEHRQLICRKCAALLIPSRTITIRIVRGRRVARCHSCGNIARTPIKCLSKDDHVERMEKGGLDDDEDDDQGIENPD